MALMIEVAPELLLLLVIAQCGCRRQPQSDFVEGLGAGSIGMGLGNCMRLEREAA